MYYGLNNLFMDADMIKVLSQIPTSKDTIIVFDKDLI